MIELPKDIRQQAVACPERYFSEHRDEKIGKVAAGGLLGLLLEEIGPAIHHRAVRDGQERLRVRTEEIGLEAHQVEFGGWRQFGRGAQRH